MKECTTQIDCPKPRLSTMIKFLTDPDEINQRKKKGYKGGNVCLNRSLRVPHWQGTRDELVGNPGGNGHPAKYYFSLLVATTSILDEKNAKHTKLTWRHVRS